MSRSLMSTATIQPDLIIALSQDRVSLNMSENTSKGRSSWHTSFKIDSIFLVEQISHALDQALFENPALMDPFPYVEIIVLDRPHFCVSRHYADQGKLGEIASRYLRMRVGDTLSTDASENDAVICYSLPTETLIMLKEYYSNLDCHHLNSVLWNNFSTQQARPEKDKVRMYLTLMGDMLILMAEKNTKLIFSKTFLIKEQGDLYYYSIACNRMLRTDENWSVELKDEPGTFELPGDSILKIEKRLSLPSLPVLMSQYKVCGS
ncbi:MAG: DUF3822 family protein [Saprospiraceae bacterium]